MSSTLFYIIQLNIILILLFVVYSIIKNKLPFWGRRLILISLPIIGGLVILIQQFLNLTAVSETLPTINLPIINISTPNQTVIKSAFNYHWILVLGSFLFISFSIYKIAKILTQFKDVKYDSTRTYKLLISEQKDSFSFFNLIHLSAHLEQEEKNIVLEHELIHYEKKHSFDIILMEVYHSLFWYNPLLFLLKKELIHVHEYEVDQQMYSKYENDYIKHLLAYALGTNSSQLLLTSQFYNKLTLTKRTKIMKNSIKKHKLLILTLPLAALAFSLVQCNKSEDTQSEPKTEQKIIASENNSKIFDAADTPPEYPGGQEAMVQHIVDNVNYPENAKQNNISGTSYIEFIVSSNGEIKDIVEVNETIDSELSQEAIRIVKLMPNWTAGKVDGEAVNVRYTLPIKFALD